MPSEGMLRSLFIITEPHVKGVVGRGALHNEAIAKITVHILKLLKAT